MRMITILLVLMLFSVLISLNTIAIPLRDGVPATGFEGNTSRNNSRWYFYEDFSDKTSLNSSKFCAGTNNASDVGNGYLNVSSISGTSLTNSLYTCKQSPYIKPDICVSINLSVKRTSATTTASSDGLIISLQNGLNLNDGDDASIGWENNQTEIRFNSGETLVKPWIGSTTGGYSLLPQVYNITMCMQATNNNNGACGETTFTAYMNNSNANNQSFMFIETDPCTKTINMSIFANSDFEVAIYSIRMFNRTEGAPTDTLITIPDTAFPIVNTTFNITSPAINDIINFTGNITDNVGLQTANITYNMSGIITYLNFTISGTSAQISNATKINCNGCVINFTMYATDVNNNVKQNSTLITVRDTITPEINMSLNDTSLTSGDSVNVSANLSDSNGLSFCRFITNQSGINEFFNKSINGADDKCSQNITIKSSPSVINFTVVVNDTSNNLGQKESVIAIGDIIIPIIINSTFNLSSITSGSEAKIIINATDNNLLQNINITFRNPDGLLFNRSCLNINFANYLCNTTLFDGDETSVNGVWNLTVASAMDVSNNLIISYPNVTLTVNAAAGGAGGSAGGGGGGGTTKTIIIKEGIPLLSFGGLTLIDFNVITTPSKKVKIIRFKNVGNVTFANAKVSIEGDADRFVNPFICDLNLQNCINESINIKAGESMFLSLNGTFTEELGKGTNGVIKIQEVKEKGVAHELSLLVSRPPLYSIAVKPLADVMGIPELLAFVVVYISTGVLIIGGIWFTTLL